MIRSIIRKLMKYTLFLFGVTMLLMGKGQLTYADIRENTAHSPFQQNSDVATIASNDDNDDESHNAGRNCHEQ